MHLLRLPSFFGPIMAGIILGSSGWIKSLIQVDTISRGFGIVFIMFCLGLEFSFPKIRKVWAVSIFSSIILFGFTVAIALVAGYYLGSNERESIMVGFCLSLSSTMVALSLFKESEAESRYGRPMIGILVIQDVLLGFILALMPTLASPSAAEAPMPMIRIFGYLLVFVASSYILERYAIRYALRSLGKKSDEAFLAVSLGYCLLLMKLAQWMDLSTEFACFIAGVMIASQEAHAQATLHLVEPLRTVFSSLFFASIGLFIYPSFLMNKWFVLASMSTFVILFKIFSTLLVMKASGLNWIRSLKIAVGLAQVSEFSFILASRAKNGNIVQREVHFACTFHNCRRIMHSWV